MMGWYQKEEVEKPKPLTERRRAERVVYLDALIGCLRRERHYQPCPILKDSRLHCTCWMAHAILFLETERERLVEQKSA